MSATQGHSVAVAHDNAFTDQIIVYLHGIGDLHQEEIGIRRKHFLHTWQTGKLLFHPVAFFLQHIHPTLYLIITVQHLQGLLLCQLVDIVGVFNLGQDAYDVCRSKGHAQTDSRTPPCFGESLQNDQIGKLVQPGQERRSLGKVCIGFVDDDNSLELPEQCPDCGKWETRLATKDEQSEFINRTTSGSDKEEEWI